MRARALCRGISDGGVDSGVGVEERSLTGKLIAGVADEEGSRGGGSEPLASNDDTGMAAFAFSLSAR